MGQNTPSIKVNAVRDRGARVVLHGDNYDEASQHAETLCEAQGQVYIPPYDDVDVIAGQGTIGMEIVNQHRSHSMRYLCPSAGAGLLPGSPPT